MGLLDWLTGKPTQDKFAQLLLTGMQKAEDTRPMRYNRNDACIFVGDDNRISVTTCSSSIVNFHGTSVTLICGS